MSEPVTDDVFSDPLGDALVETADADLNAKLNRVFAGRVVRKDLTQRLKEGAKSLAA